MIPIDDDLCNGSKVVTPTTPPPTTLPTSPTQPKTTCEAANLLASEVPTRVQSPIFDATEACASFPNCSGVHCSAVYQYNNYSGKLYFLPCATPPAVRLVLDDNSGAVHIDRLINKNTTIPFVVHGLSVDVIVTLIHQTDDSLLFAVCGLHGVDRCIHMWAVINACVGCHFCDPRQQNACTNDAKHSVF